MSREFLASQLTALIDRGVGKQDTLVQFRKAIECGKALTRDEGEKVHVGVFIMAIDPRVGEVFIGLHKKSGKWIPHGGHIDEGETIEQTLEREIGEEWGMRMKARDIGKPVLLTVTEIDKPELWNKCKVHLDVWYFVHVNKNIFSVAPEISHKEFIETRWATINKALDLTTSPAVKEALDLARTDILASRNRLLRYSS